MITDVRAKQHQGKVRASRYSELKQILETRRRELQEAVRGQMRDVWSDVTCAGTANDVRDAAECSDADVQGDLELALLQMKSETLGKVTDALTRLEEGDYGSCVDCRGEIADNRLRAMPFATRCTRCEEEKEDAARRQRQGLRIGPHLLEYLNRTI